MEHVEWRNPKPLLPPPDEWFIRPSYARVHAYTHTHATQPLAGCVPRPPAVPAAFEDAPSRIHLTQSLFFSPSTLFLGCFQRATQVRTLLHCVAKWQLIPPKN